MPELGKIIKELLAENHPVLHADQLKDGENILHEDANGTKFVATKSQGKIALAVFDGAGKQGSLIRIQPPPPARPNHILVCVCSPVSTAWGEGVRCWWYNND